ncbi:MAG: protease modulator HflC [Oscillospiraceae bacterium]|nr:protease modulator HflC [Oscillospiraceae bacterium]
MKSVKRLVIVLAILVVAIIGISSSTFTVNRDEYAVVKQFGKVVTIYEETGLKFKIPFVQSVEKLPKKQLIYDLPVSEVITKDKQTMVADSFAIWRISDPQLFIKSLSGSVANAESRIEMLVYNAMKNEISSRTQAEVIGDRTGKLAADITDAAKPNFAQYGIELLSVETKHLDLPYDNKASVFNRMVSERNALSASFTAEGEKEAQIIRSETDREIAIMIAEAEALAEQMRAEGEAEYMRLLSEAYNNEDKAAFYEFVRALDALKIALDNGENVIVLSPDSPIVKILYGYAEPAQPAQ